MADNPHLANLFGETNDRDAEKELRRLLRKTEQAIKRDLRKKKPKLFRALGEFANMRADKDAWVHYRNTWPFFFPSSEYKRVETGERDSIANYPELLDRVWRGYESGAILMALLGLSPESSLTNPSADLPRIRRIPAQFFADWVDGVLHYRGMCNFQNALYLLFQESWRARVCEKCGAKFVAQRAAQKYCSTDCSEEMQRDLKRDWWAKHGNTWRTQRGTQRAKKKGGSNVTRKAR